MIPRPPPLAPHGERRGRIAITTEAAGIIGTDGAAPAGATGYTGCDGGGGVNPKPFATERVSAVHAEVISLGADPPLADHPVRGDDLLWALAATFACEYQSEMWFDCLTEFDRRDRWSEEAQRMFGKPSWCRSCTARAVVEGESE